MQRKYQEIIEKRINEKYGSKKAWLDKYEISSERFYNFLKGQYNPTLETLELWLKTLDLQIVIKEN